MHTIKSILAGSLLCFAAAGCRGASGTGSAAKAPSQFVPAVPQAAPTAVTNRPNAAAWSLMGRSKYAEARDLFSKAAANTKAGANERADADIGVGESYQAQRQFDKARAAYAAALALPGIAPAQKARAELAAAKTFAYQKNGPRARAAYQAIAGKPVDDDERADALMGIASTFMLTNDYQSARFQLGAIAADPTIDVRHRGQARIAIAQTYMAQDKPALAKPEFAGAAAISNIPPDLRILAEFNLATAQVLTKDYAGATATYQKIDADPAAAQTDRASADNQLKLLQNLPKAQTNPPPARKKP